MKLKTLHLMHFMSYVDTTLQFTNNGIITIYGEDQQTHEKIGVGKSAIIEGIKCLLFGKTKFTSLVDAIQFNQVFFRVSGELELQDGQTLNICREKDKKGITKLSILLNNKDITQETNTLTQTKIEQIIGITYEKFNLIYSFGQSEYDDLRQLKNGKLIDLFLSIFDLTKFLNIKESVVSNKKKILDKITETNAQVTALVTSIDKINNCVVGKDTHLKKRLQQINNWKYLLPLILEKKQQEIKYQNSFADGVKQSLYECSVKIKQCETKLQYLKTTNICKECGQVFNDTIKQSLSEITTQLKAQLSIERQKLSDRLAYLVEQVNTLKQQEQKCLKQAGILNTFLKNYNYRLQLMQTIQSKDSFTKLIALKNKMVQQLTKKVAVYTEIETVFDSKGFAYFLLQEVLPQLEILINNYLQEVCDFTLSFDFFKQNKTNDNVKAQLTFNLFKNENKYSLDNLSNGQLFIITLCVRLGMGELFTNQLGQHINMLIIDDEFGKADDLVNMKILKLLNYLYDKKHFQQIFVLTHSEDIRNNIDTERLGQHIFINFNSGVSNITNE